MKWEWKKHEKEIYLPKGGPVVQTIGPQKFIVLSGEGNPNGEGFSLCIEALYSLSYAVKMNLKKRDNPPQGYQDYTVYPLEGIWDLKEEARQKAQGHFNKEDLVYQVMIRQPDFVSPELFEEYRELVKVKKPHPLLDQARFETIEDGLCVQMMHIGPYDDEPESFQKMETYISGQGYERLSKTHREIYLSDFRKTAPEKLKTLLRFKVKPL